MSEEHLTPTFEERESSNTVAVVALVFSIIWLILLITIFGIFLGIGALIIGLILWLIWLYKAPRGKAWAAIILSIIPLGLIWYGCYYVFNNIKEPANEFAQWAEANLNEEDFKDIDNDRFNAIAKFIAEEKINEIKWEDAETILANMTGDNVLQKGAYFFFDYMKEVFTDSLEAYKAWVVIEPSNEWAISFSIDSSSTGDVVIEEPIEDDTACIDIYEPVCGIDGNVYGNSCYLEKAGVEIDEESTATESGCVSE